MPGPWIAPNATVVGDVRLGDDASVWYGAVVRADLAPITVGAGSNIQDNAVLHADPGFALVIEDGVSVGHGAVLHGCTIGAGALVGMGAVVMNGAVIGAGSTVAAGAVVPAGTVVPPASLVAGVPGRVRRELTSEDVEGNRLNAQVYVDLAHRHRDGAYPAYGA